MNLGNKIMTLRKKNNLSQEDLAEKVGVTRQTLLIMLSFKRFNNDRVIVGKASVSCKLNSEEYLYEVEYNKNYQVINAGGDAFIPNHIDVEKYEDINQIIAHIEDYFSEHNGSCEVNYSK